MVAADDRQAAQWGTEILNRGGNAIDAAVATAFGMAVTRPHYASLGGGGFMVYCPAPKNGLAGECTVLDFREKAPLTAKKDMYVRNGKADTTLSQQGALASGTPGVPAGLVSALSQFGTRKLSQVLSEPIQWARQGIKVSAHTETALKFSWNSFNPEARRIFSCRKISEEPCKAGDTLTQKDLSKTLSLLSKIGHDGFYRGVTAKRIVEAMKVDGGIITANDLASYKTQMRKPIIGKFKDYEIVTMPPPSSGGIL
jgi:gamma-glutamyltranspeptidase/glutathione hydrolase